MAEASVQDEYILVQSVDRREAYRCTQEINESNVLGGSDRLHKLLSYLVEEELEGRGDWLKAYSIALDVYDKGEDFNPATNSIVRVEMHRLRKALELFDATYEGDFDLRLGFDKGSYRPVFRRKRAPQILPANIVNNMPGWIGSLHMQPRLLIGIATSILAMLLSIMALSGHKAGKQCLRPGLSYIIAESAQEANKLPYDYAYGTFAEVLRAYSLVSSVQAENDCDTAPQFTLQITPVSNGGKYSLEASLSLRQLDEQPIWLRNFEVTSFDNREELGIALARIGHIIAAYDGIIPSRALNMDWQNSHARGEYSCLIDGYYFMEEHDDKDFGENYECLRQYANRDSPFSDVHALYAQFIQLQIIGRIEYDIPEAQNEYNKAINTSFAINHFNSGALTARLREYRKGDDPKMDRLNSVLRVVDKNYRYHANMLYQFSMVEGVYFGNWDSSREKIDRAVAISGDRPEYQYAIVGNQIVRNEWQDAVERMRSNQSIVNFEDALLLFTVGLYGSDKLLMDQGISYMKSVNMYDYELLVKYVRNTHFHNSYKQVMLNAINRHFNRAPEEVAG